MKQEIQIHADGDNRVITFTVRKPMDIAPQAFSIPFSMLKVALGQVIAAEGQTEMQEQSRRVVAPART